MPRSAPTFLFALAPAVLVACGSGGSDSDATGGSGGASASGGVIASGGMNATGGTGGSLPTGGSSTNGGRVGMGSGGRSTGGVPASGGSGGMGSGNQPSTGGFTASAGTGGGAAGQSTAGGSSGSGGRSAGGRAGTGGAQNTGGAAAGAGGSAGTAGTAGTGGMAPSATCPDATWNLVWGDDFEGASGTAADSSKWTYDSGPNWFNGELQYYAAGTDNASLDGNGNLVIEARQQTREGRQYTSARLKTEGKKTFTYGRFEGRMKLPYGQGIWPAFWMLGGNSWPNTGEIDIMENLGREPTIAHGTIHGPGYSGADGPTATYTLPGGAVFSDDFHTFAIEWEMNAIRWYVDGTLYSTKTPADIGGNDWVFDHGFFFILNVAVGGDWPGDPDGTTVFPQKLLIDYVHVCEK
jgi:beta-glucanase (GH16 family)